MNDTNCLGSASGADSASDASVRVKDVRQTRLQRFCRTCRLNRGGAAVVEFAVVAPVFFAFLLGMVEMGRAVMVQQILTNASREGARRAVLDGATYTEVQTYINTYLQNASINAAGYQVTVSPTLPTADDYDGPVTVTVSVPFSQVNWGPAPIFLQGSTLQASTIMRREKT